MSLLRLARACASVPARSTPILLGRMGLPPSKTLIKPMLHGPNLLSTRLASTRPGALPPSRRWTWRHAVLGGTVLLGGGYGAWAGWRVYDQRYKKKIEAAQDMLVVKEACEELMDDARKAKRAFKELFRGADRQLDGGESKEGRGEKLDVAAAKERLKACKEAVGKAATKHMERKGQPAVAAKEHGPAVEAAAGEQEQPRRPAYQRVRPFSIEHFMQAKEVLELELEKAIEREKGGGVKESGEAEKEGERATSITGGGRRDGEKKAGGRERVGVGFQGEVGDAIDIRGGIRALDEFIEWAKKREEKSARDEVQGAETAAAVEATADGN